MYKTFINNNFLFMSQFSKIFKKVPTQIQNRNGFDLGHSNFFTGKTGTLIPIVCHPVLPDTYINYGYAGEVQLPPLASDAYGNIKAKVECFFVPNRLLFGGWKYWMSNYSSDGSIASYGSSGGPNKYLPSVRIPYGSCGPGSLADYLGMQVLDNAPAGETASDFQLKNPLKFLAYHKIWEDHYRNANLQKPAFVNPYQLSSSLKTDLWQTKFLPFVSASSQSIIEFTGTLNDGKNIYDLRQRNWPKDYFTNATPKPQAGNESSLQFSVDSESGTGSFTISALRAANSLQMWLERNNMAGERYSDQIKARFGCYPADSTTDRSIYLGDGTFNVYNKSVYQSNYLGTDDVGANPDAGNGRLPNSPFTSVGTKYASPMGVSQGQNIVNNYHVTEHGYFVVLFSLVPQVTYSTGVDPHFFANQVTQWADPLLAGIGDEPIYNFELMNVFGSAQNSSGSDTFGYTQRYSSWKFIKDQVHGLLRDDSSLLSSFALQRSFDSVPELGTEFIEIPQGYLDQITAFQASDTYFGYWANIYNNLKISTPLPAYSIPTLGLPSDTHTELINLHGTHL